MTGRYYSLLGLENGADKESIKQAFRRLAVVFHPDKGAVHRQRFSEICEAYHALMAVDQVQATPIYASSVAPLNIQSKSLSANKDRRYGRRGSPGDRRFETILEEQYKGRHLKIRA